MFPSPSIIKANDIDLAVYEQGEGPPVVLAAWFPGTGVFLAISAPGTCRVLDSAR